MTRRLLLVALLAIACGDGTDPDSPVALGLVTQPPGAAQIGIALAQAPVVELRNRRGTPVAQAGVRVTASIAEGGGTLTGTTTRTTDAGGRATFADLAISGTVGARTLRFAADGLAAVTSSSITLTPGLPATMEPASSLQLQGPAGTDLVVLPSVRIKDAGGNAVPGVPVTFTLAGGGGVVSGATQSTNAAGIATLGGWTLPTTVGQYTLHASAVGFARIPFTATVLHGVPHTMQPSGGGQSALYGSTLLTPLQVRVVDQHGNPTPGVVVTWGSVSGLGTVEPIDAATDANGIARSRYRLGTIPGGNVVRASINSLGLSADIAATARGFTNEISTAPYNTCAIDDANVLYCWGDNTAFQIGDGTNAIRPTPRPIGGALRFRRVSVGTVTTCALTTDNIAYCWGSNGWVALGDGSTVTQRSVPTAVSGGHRFTEISTSGQVTCALTTAGAAYCWGANTSGQLGVGTATVQSCITHIGPNSFPCSRTPIAVAGGLTFTAISVAGAHACALTASGELYCWGNQFALGPPGAVGVDNAPVRAAAALNFSTMSSGSGYVCGIVAPSSLYCWGAGDFGILGTGSTDRQSTPVLVPSVAAAQVDGGGYGTCAVATDGRAFCWGYNLYGAVGDGTTTQRTSPTAVSTDLSFTAISTSGFHTCGRTGAGQVYCWGDNVQGELGVGGGPDRLTPTLARP
ncbi:MAG: hypothetical protein ABR499_05515 [Gemmatimonadaceae bacterium]